MNNLIEEIEAADTTITSEFRETDWWLRIKSALEAAQEMDAEFESFVRAYQIAESSPRSQRKFRAAFESKP